MAINRVSDLGWMSEPTKIHLLDTTVARANIFNGNDGHIDQDINVNLDDVGSYSNILFECSEPTPNYLASVNKSDLHNSNALNDAAIDRNPTYLSKKLTYSQLVMNAIIPDTKTVFNATNDLLSPGNPPRTSRLWNSEISNYDGDKTYSVNTDISLSSLAYGPFRYYGPKIFEDSVKFNNGISVNGDIHLSNTYVSDLKTENIILDGYLASPSIMISSIWLYKNNSVNEEVTSDTDAASEDGDTDANSFIWVDTSFMFTKRVNVDNLTLNNDNLRVNADDSDGEPIHRLYNVAIMTGTKTLSGNAQHGMVIDNLTTINGFRSNNNNNKQVVFNETRLSSNNDVLSIDSNLLLGKHESPSRKVNGVDIELNDSTANTAMIGTKNLSCNDIYCNYLYGIASRALWADFAEMYVADEKYEPGTLVKFGGEKEITIADNDVNAVVSENPGFLLNSEIKDGTPIALAGRVRIKAKGKVKKFDKLCLSKIPGVAEACNSQSSTTIARALEDKDCEDVGLVECVVKFNL